MTDLNNSENVKIEYDDELDDDFEDTLDKTPAPEYEKILESFENPKGLEEDPNSGVNAGPSLGSDEIEKLHKYLKNQPTQVVDQLMKNMTQAKDNGLGNTNFRHVSSEHKTDSAARLKAALKNKKFNRLSKAQKEPILTKQKEKQEELKTAIETAIANIKRAEVEEKRQKEALELAKSKIESRDNALDSAEVKIENIEKIEKLDITDEQFDDLVKTKEAEGAEPSKKSRTSIKTTKHVHDKNCKH